MLTLLLMLLTATQPKPLKTYNVVSSPVKTVTAMPNGLAYVIRFPEGNIVTCDSDYGLYVRPIVKDSYSFLYAAPGSEIHEDKDHQFIVACLKIQ
jgi:hypothetical protein